MKRPINDTIHYFNTEVVDVFECEGTYLTDRRLTQRREAIALSRSQRFEMRNKASGRRRSDHQHPKISIFV